MVVLVSISCLTGARWSCRGQLVSCPRCCCGIVAWECSTVRLALPFHLRWQFLLVFCLYFVCGAYVCVICKAHGFLVMYLDSGCTGAWSVVCWPFCAFRIVQILCLFRERSVLDFRMQSFMCMCTGVQECRNDSWMLCCKSSRGEKGSAYKLLLMLACLVYVMNLG